MNDNYPNHINADWLIEDGKQHRAGLPDGRWVAARPICAPSVAERIKRAWDVFTGKADALYWTQQ